MIRIVRTSTLRDLREALTLATEQEAKQRALNIELCSSLISLTTSSHALMDALYGSDSVILPPPGGLVA